MRSSFNRFVGALALVGAAVGCSSNDDDEARSGADAALAERTCFVGLEVPGVTYDGPACSGGDTYSSVSGISSSFDTVVQISLRLDSPPAVGALSVSSLTIDLPTDGTSHVWNAPSSCAVVATATAVDPDFGWDYYRIDISCTEPALPASGNTGEPLELGDFSIVTFFAQG